MTSICQNYRPCLRTLGAFGVCREVSTVDVVGSRRQPATVRRLAHDSPFSQGLHSTG